MVFPFEAKITPEDCYWGTLLSCAEMARYGCVSFSDMYYHMEEGARAALDAGIKMNLSDSLLAFNGEGLDDLPVKDDESGRMPPERTFTDKQNRNAAACRA